MASPFFGTRLCFRKGPKLFFKIVRAILPRSGRALAIADGEGRKAIWLAGQGSLLKNPRHGESVVIQFSVTNRRRLACGAHL